MPRSEQCPEQEMPRGSLTIKQGSNLNRQIQIRKITSSRKTRGQTGQTHYGADHSTEQCHTSQQGCWLSMSFATTIRPVDKTQARRDLPGQPGQRCGPASRGPHQYYDHAHKRDIHVLRLSSPALGSRRRLPHPFGSSASSSPTIIHE